MTSIIRDKKPIFVQIYTFHPTFGQKSPYFRPNLYFLPHIWTKILVFIPKSITFAVEKKHLCEWKNSLDVNVNAKS